MGAIMQLSDRFGSRMKLQDLHVLMTVVQTGSMGKAAQILNTCAYRKPHSAMFADEIPCFC